MPTRAACKRKLEDDEMVPTSKDKNSELKLSELSKKKNNPKKQSEPEIKKADVKQMTIEEKSHEPEVRILKEENNINDESDYKPNKKSKNGVNGKPEKKKKFARGALQKVEASEMSSIIKTELTGSTKYVGAHCSIAGGVSNAVLEAKSLGARAFGLFVRNGRTWKLNSLNEAEAEKFRTACKEHGFPPHLILPHGSYLLNCGSSNPDTLQKSRDTLVHELKLCEQLGLTLYNFHPGSACGEGSVKDCIATIADSINMAHTKTKFVKTVIENMSCQGKTVGGKLEELKTIIDGVTDKSRVGVCLDTCHAFAAGFDVSSEVGYNKLIEDFDKTIGLQYLCALHLNDSKGALGCHLDRHENIGKGRIGLDGFRRIMNDPRLDNIPMILETPVNDYAKEIKILYKLEHA